MSKEELLNEDWSDYDDKKKKGVDSRFFSCEEEWEVNYLVRKIHEKYPKILKEKIEVSIKQCCNIVPAPRPREKFVDCVLTRLGIGGGGDSGGGNPPQNPGPGPKNPPTPPGNRNVG